MSSITIVWVTVTSYILGLGSGMGVTFNRISENISEGQGTDWRYFECLGSFVVSTNGNICGNLKMVFLFLPQLAELVPVGCLGE